MSSVASAQFTFNGQVRTRTEYQNGQGTLLKEADSYVCEGEKGAFTETWLFA